jgi:hypothetical protein
LVISEGYKENLLQYIEKSSDPTYSAFSSMAFCDLWAQKCLFYFNEKPSKPSSQQEMNQVKPKALNMQ